MRLFGTKAKKDKVLPDVKESPAPRESMVVVWLLSIATFFATVAVVLLLFWGGRWVIHTVYERNKVVVAPVKPAAPAPAPRVAVAPQPPNGPLPVSNNRDSSRGIVVPSNPAPAPAPQSSSSTSFAPPTHVNTPTSSVAQTPKTTPNTGPAAATTLVNTGPTSDD